MDIYSSLSEAVTQEFDTIRQIKESERGTISVVRHRSTGTHYIFRRFTGSGGVYRELLPVACPYLPQIMEVGERDGQTVVLEEYIQGDTLGEVLEGGLLAPAEAKRILLQLCTALWIIHAMGAVHRDIKPDNVLLRGKDAVLTQVLGTTGFAAPEQYGLSQSDARTDIYALGVLLNVMLTGKHPSGELAAGKMGHIVQRCTMINPRKRYQNVLRLMEAL